jgi:hypothetical protein
VNEPTLADVIARLDAIEKKVEALPMEMGALIATTASHEDVCAVQGSIDVLDRRLDLHEERCTLTEIRRDLRRVV